MGSGKLYNPEGGFSVYLYTTVGEAVVINGYRCKIIKKITDAIESVKGIRLLDVDPGEATNRTVVTFVGEPEAVVEAAFRSVRRASELIDMNLHHGSHPRSQLLPRPRPLHLGLHDKLSISLKNDRRWALRIL